MGSSLKAYIRSYALSMDSSFPTSLALSASAQRRRHRPWPWSWSWSWLGHGSSFLFMIGFLLLFTLFLIRLSGSMHIIGSPHIIVLHNRLSRMPLSTHADMIPSPSTNYSSTRRLALCLVGGARDFEVTEPTIRKYLLQALPDVDVFLHSPLDKDSYKLSLLGGLPINLVHFRIIDPKPIIMESMTYTDVFTTSGSPHGIQGLLQYFNLVEGCVNMIKRHQQLHNFTYEWIIRTRLDGYWNGYLPPLDTMDQESYNVPIGSRYGGLNDRLGIGNWETSEVALSRLSLLPLIHERGAKGLNSESYFKMQLQVKRITYKTFDFPFCILSRRKYGWPPGVPVASISSKGPLNGAKCRPCHPISIGNEAKSIVRGMDRYWGWIGNVEEIELCDATRDWEPDWRDTHKNLVVALNQSVSECIQAHQALRKDVQVWDAPTPEVICEEGLRA